MTRTLVIASLLAGLTLGAGCARLGDSVARLNPFGPDTKTQGRGVEAKLTTLGDKRNFRIRVTPVLADIREIRAEARYAATQHCIGRIGSSEVDWVIDPATGEIAEPIEGNAMVFRGRCRS
ncbi:hypothetical protein DDZ14_01875 [Maritimibacter sp. 55A14]|uniref:hypothetical protein n=1 Tax=Maritimibacter sp. 55A14 TaxID=2174844 RepID=UPI000D61A51E|nr:hypothetical protein [Maritimibacter sp. 55A14]PWE33939.1 hypothetical protein DDZ14_01875 [Maritimibacter sp. 55A14]